MSDLKINSGVVIDYSAEGWDEFVKWLDGTYAYLRYAWVDEGEAYQIAAPDGVVCRTFSINKDDATEFEASYKNNEILESRTVAGDTVIADRMLTLGRDSFKRHDDGTEQMNVDGRAAGTEVVLWNGTGGGDSGGDWSASGTGSETAGSMHSGTNGWDTGIMAENNSVVFDNGSMIDINGTYGELKLWINPQAFPATSRPRISWLDNTDTLVGNNLRLDDYTENMDLNVWQQVSIPIVDFGLTGNVQKLRLQARNTAGQDYWLDDVSLMASSGGGPYRFKFEAPVGSIYHVSMLVLQVVGPSAGWDSDAFGSIAGGLTNGLILRQRRLSDSEVIWKFIAKDNVSLFGYYHPQDDIAFADGNMLVGFMVKPGKATIRVTNDDVLEFVIRDDLSSIANLRAYAHYGIEVVS